MTELEAAMPKLNDTKCRDLSWLLSLGAGTPEHEFAQARFNSGFWDGVNDRKAHRDAPTFWKLGTHHCPTYEAGWEYGNALEPSEVGTSSFPHWADLLVGLRRETEELDRRGPGDWRG